ncbi:alginate lyase family protein [Bacteroides sp. 51]|uniref:alginate lyase family protein n=1 Tax=Bacteroides sp. 51 TaxID=2302938 RepID=UPI0013D0FD4B|nr:alginate lyase family protein [Bacteroides sp. 51]NDV81780.1 hypothetical protein [Bacteroides sp. 51]
MKKKTIIASIIVCCLLCACSQKPTASFIHPGMAQNQQDLDYMCQMIQADAQPWKSAYENLQQETSLDFVPQAFDRISVGPYGANSIGGREFSQSAEAAYNHALMWYITRDKAYAGKAIEILNAWSYKLRSFDANNAKLNVGLFGYHYLNAAEILKYTESDWAPNDMEQFTRMVLTVFYPTIEDFFTEANGNWDASMINTMMCIGVFVDNHEIFNRAVERFYWGERNSGITKYLYPGGQCQETTRDWGHVQLGIGEFAKAAQIAFTQGLDFYRVADDRLARGFEYTARFMLGGHIDLFGVYTTRDNDRFRDIYESIYSHYKQTRGITLPYTEEAIMKHTRSKSSVGFLTGVRSGASNADTDAMKELDPERFLMPTEAGALNGKYAEAPEDAVLVRPGESIQKAVDAHKGTGKWIVLRAGVHTLQEPLKLYSGMTLAGEGRETILHLAGGLHATTIINGTDSLEDVVIRDLLIEGAVNTVENGDPNHDRRTRSYMSAPSREGIVFWSEDNAIRNIRFEQLTVQNFTKNGVMVVGASDIRISQCDFSDNGGSVVPGEGFHHNLLLSYVADCTLWKSRFDTSPWGNGIDATFCQGLTVEACEMARNKRSGIRCAESADIILVGNRAEGNDRHGIAIEKRMDSCQGVTIRNNTLLNNTGKGVYTQAVVQLSAEENRAENNGAE